jgi:hypothetical protein
MDFEELLVRVRAMVGRGDGCRKMPNAEDGTTEIFTTEK